MEYRSSLKLIGSVVFLAVLSMGCVSLYSSLLEWDSLAAGEITVNGIKRLSISEVLYQAGIHKGINILSVNTEIARRRLLAHPWIAQADVTRTFPGWTGNPTAFHIEITEHIPLAVFEFEHKYLVNGRGEIFKRWAPSDPVLPLIKGLKLSDLNILEKNNDISFKSVMDVLQFGSQPENIIPNRLIRQINVDREMGLHLLVKPDDALFQIHEIRLGYYNYEEKYAQLQRLLAYLKETQSDMRIRSIDLNDLDRVVVAPASTESPARIPNEEV
jgi:cell division protein FtsQ